MSLVYWLCVQSSECGQICEAVAKATEYFPPQLAGQGRGNDDVTAGRAGLQLDGSWASRRCESRPYGVQLTRHYQFSEMDGTWSSRHSYFSDVSCRHSLYSLDVSGRFSLHDQPSTILDDAYHIDFNVSIITYTVLRGTTVRPTSFDPATCSSVAATQRQQSSLWANYAHFRHDNSVTFQFQFIVSR